MPSQLRGFSGRVAHSDNRKDLHSSVPRPTRDGYYFLAVLLRTADFERTAVSLHHRRGRHRNSNKRIPRRNFCAGIAAVPRGQIEAARAIGLSAFWVVWDVVAPQAIKMMIPPILGIVAIMIKNSALVSAIGVGELFYQATVLSGQTFHYLEFLSASAFLYIALIMPLSIALQWAERRLEEKAR